MLVNTGYYHGYKGYRFFNTSRTRLPFRTYDEVYATIQYDSALKALMYGKMMFIETAVKNIALEAILVRSNSESIQTMYDKVISGYKTLHQMQQKTSGRNSNEISSTYKIQFSQFLLKLIARTTQK